MSNAKIERLRWRGTRYEAVVVRADGERRLLAYCARHSRTGLYSAIQERQQHVVVFLGLSETATIAWLNGAFHLSPGHKIQWSGRTQRDAVVAGELLYIASDENQI